MTFLPIVERELRIAARRQMSYWLRVIAAAFMLLMFVMTLVLFTMSSPFGSPGQAQFSTLRWIAFIFVCSTGVFFTSDSLSEEKREGTLGLLFLTDLHGYDVVLGKLMSHSLQAFYSLLAALPILALPLLVGGVTGTEFARSLLVICNTLFLSLAVGIFASSISREVMKTMNATLFINLALLVGLPWLDLGLTHWDDTKFKPITSVLSPGFLFEHAGDLKGSFWSYLGLQNLLAWIFLAAAAICIPRAWQEKTASAKGPRRSMIQWWRYGGRKARLAFRRKTLSRDSILWLALRDLWMARLIWLAVLIAALWMGMDLYIWDSQKAYNALSSAHALLVVVIMLWVASQACRFFVESSRNGALELILVTPVKPRQIVFAQWKAICRNFWLPVLVILAMQVVSLVHEISNARHLLTPPSTPLDTYWIISGICGLVTLAGDFLAMAWFGMWMGVTSRKASMAILKTVCFVVVLPYLIQMFIMVFGMMSAGRARLPFWIGVVFAGIFELVKNIFLIWWARNQLLTRFAERVARGNETMIHRPQLSSRTAPITVAPPIIT
ncbi:MAG TPA: ABC transporter permease [Verrucomicrobiae bacterium]|jgi:ABC-type transport system involved in cytochrome c biogenesis permease component|nr:ABC transporter permease [Verrucomicrobiae bacterium]